jgi:4-alpha-glucanotransferase
MVAAAMGSVADHCIIPVQDYLGLGSEARINIPSTVGSNWKWRMKKGALSSEIIEKMAGMAKMYGRYNPVNKPVVEDEETSK